MGLNLRTVSFFLIVVSFGFFAASEARRFYVGGNGGWVTNPPENYNTWAERNRFRVHDTLHFKYPKGSDSVLEVSKGDYDSCNTSNPIKKMDDGDSEFVFDRSGPFYFISGNEDHCKKGQRLHVVVLAVRPKPPTAQPPHSAAPAKSPSSAPSPKSPSPVSPSPSGSPAKSPPPSPSHVSPTPSGSPAKSPVTPPSSPSPVSHSPSGSPAKSPVTPPPSPSPVSHSPTVSPTLSPAKSPSTPPSSTSPTPSASPKKSPSPAATPPANSPELSPKSSPPSTTITPPPGSATTPTPETPIIPGDITAPAPSPSRKKSSGSVLAVTSVTTVLSVALTVLMTV